MNELGNLPLEIIRPRVFILLVRTKRTCIARRVVNKSMPDHLILALKTLAPNAPRAPFNRAEVGAFLRVRIDMRAIAR